MTTLATAPPVYARVEPLFRGETIVCLGGGSSLTAEDCAFVRGKARVIAIKEAGACRIPGHVAPAPWADCLYAADDRWWRFVNGAPEFGGLKFAIEPQPIAWPGVQVLRNAGVTGLSSDPSALCTGHNSGYQALGLAYHFGAARVLLLGFDMWRGPSGANWFGDHPTHLASPYPMFIQAFASIAEPLKAAGVEVVNCTAGFSALTCFPKALLQDVLR